MGNIATQFEAAGNLLRMDPFDSRAKGEIRRAAENEIESSGRVEHGGFAEVAMADFVTVFKSIVTRRFPGEPDAFILRLNRHEPRTGQSPRRNHPDRADATAKIERGTGGRAPRRAVPCGEDVVGGEAMAVAQLKDAEVAADGIERFVFRRLDAAGRHRTRLGPAFEKRLAEGMVHEGILKWKAANANAEHRMLPRDLQEIA